MNNSMHKRRVVGVKLNEEVKKAKVGCVDLTLPTPTTLEEMMRCLGIQKRTKDLDEFLPENN